MEPPGGSRRLARVVGVSGAVMMGLGSILGTGIFVGIGVASAVAGPAVLPAVILAAVLAVFNGLSSARLAALHPVSGGTYEYGYRWLGAVPGFTAGWMFLCAKSASAATAAMGCAGYLLNMTGWTAGILQPWTTLGVVGVVTVVVAAGMRLSSRMNVLIVTITLLALGLFVAAGLPGAVRGAQGIPLGDWMGGERGWRPLMEATALMFVAYTGYGRVATLGEEIRDPRKNIPRAILATLVATLLVYGAVAFVVATPGAAERLGATGADAAAPLEGVARGFDLPWVARWVGVGAVTAMLGVLLNLLLGLSRVLLAMARRGDMPRGWARVEGGTGSPRRAVWVMGVLIAVIAASGSVRLTWSFSAFTVLVYYALTHLAALRVASREGGCPRWVPVAGMVGCLGLAFQVEPAAWIAGCLCIGAGWAWHGAARRLRSRTAP